MMGAKRSAWMGIQSCRISRFNGSDKLVTRSARDNKSRVIFIVGIGISLCLIPSTSMASTDTLRYTTINYVKISYEKR